MGTQTKIIDGVKIAAEIRLGLKQEVDALLNAGLQPGLAVVLVGNDAAGLLRDNIFRGRTCNVLKLRDSLTESLRCAGSRTRIRSLCAWGFRF